MVLAAVVPVLTGAHVFAGSVPPLLAHWRPRVGLGTVPALVIVGAATTRGRALAAAQRLPWRSLLAVTYAAAVAWMLSLALVDGPAGIDRILADSTEYLQTARTTSDLSATLHEYIARIPFTRADHWPVHIAGHPPGALLFFVLLVHLGLGSGLAAGLVVVLVAGTTPVAVAVTLRELAAERPMRFALPFLVIGPSAIWQAVSADAMFAAVAAWGIAALALGANRRSRAWSLLAGLLLGYCVMLSYGLPLLAILAVAVLLLARSLRPLPWAALAAGAVLVAFALAGFAWWDALPVLHSRYWSGIARHRPAWYWLWGNLAALTVSAGPVLGPGLACAATSLRSSLRDADRRVVTVLSGAALLMVVAADASLMSKAEVERIWLPFVPWLLLATARLPERWRGRAFAVQAVFALVLQHLLWSKW